MKRLPIAMMLSFLFCSCSNHGVSEEDMKTAGSAVEAQFGLKDVNIVMLSNKKMQIAVPSVRFIDSPSGYKQIMADSIAQACKAFIDKETLSGSTVIFLRNPGYIANQNEQTAVYKVNLK